MGRKLVRSANLTLTYVILQADRSHKPTCARCRTKLDLHQPIPATPHQLLATCSGCHGWYRLEIRSGETQAVLVTLPEVASLIPAAAPGPASVPTS